MATEVICDLRARLGLWEAKVSSLDQGGNMKRPHVSRSPICAALAVALGALAMLALPGFAAAKDRNHDRIPDRWEKHHRLSLKVDQGRRDQDRDHLRNRAEFLAGDNPRSADSDGDGLPDGEENAGTIQSFDAATGRLVIDLFGTETISGLVTGGTEIECEHESSSASTSDSNRGEDNSGDQEGASGEDNSGSGSPGPGDDNADLGDEGGENASCTTADLVPGAVVQEAELQIENGTATFEEVELAG
jgi:hypothetical protein